MEMTRYCLRCDKFFNHEQSTSHASCGEIIELPQENKETYRELASLRKRVIQLEKSNVNNPTDTTAK